MLNGHQILPYPANRITYNQSQRTLDIPHHPTPTNSGRPSDSTSTQYGTIHPATTTYNNHLATLQTDLHQCPPLPLLQSRFDTNTNQPSYPETQHKLRSYSNHPEIITIVALTTSCNIPHSTENHTQLNTTDTSQAPQPFTDNTSPFITTLHSQVTVLVAHLQHLYHPPPTTHIITTIVTQTIWSDLQQTLQPFTEANTAPMALKHAPKSPQITAAASSIQNSMTPLISQPYPTVSLPPSCNNMTQSPLRVYLLQTSSNCQPLCYTKLNLQHQRIITSFPHQATRQICMKHTKR